MESEKLEFNCQIDNIVEKQLNLEKTEKNRPYRKSLKLRKFHEKCMWLINKNLQQTYEW